MDARRRAEIWAVIAASLREHSPRPILSRFCDVCAETLAVDAVVLGLRAGGTAPEIAHATGVLGKRLWELQITLGEGPAADAVHVGEPIVSSDLTHAAESRRWPVFAPAAAGTGIRSVAAIPLQVGMVGLGVLELARQQPGGFAEQELADAFTFAEFGLNLAMSLHTDAEEPGPASDEASGMNTEVHQATGMVTAQLDTGGEAALLRMRAYAFTHDVPLTEVALAVLARILRFHPDGTDP